MMTSNITLEVCAFNVNSCMIAEKAGAVRVELCDNPYEGGTTPSYGTIKQAREKIAIHLYPIIRPRGGNFLYDENEMGIIKKDITICRELGCDGIATGVHTHNGEIDMEKMKKIVEWAGPMGVTCHRVFDLTPDPFRALEALIACGVTRILTSGQEATAMQGAITIKKLVEAASGRVTIMAGGGVRANNIAALIRQTRAFEYHTSARMSLQDTVIYPENNILQAGNIVSADASELQQIIKEIKGFNRQA